MTGIDDELSKDWLLIIISTTFFGAKESEVYQNVFSYSIERPLTMICANGLYFFQQELKKEVQEKSNLDFYIGDLIADMKG